MRVFSLAMTGGHLEDAFVYRSHVYCWTIDRRLRVYAVQDIEAAVEKLHGSTGSIVTYALFHTRGRAASDVQSGAWRDYFVGAGKKTLDISIDAEAVPYFEAAVFVDTDSLLDLLIYYDQLFMATAEGLYSAGTGGILEEPRSPHGLRPERRVSQPSYSASAGLGTVAVSCGPKGLRLLFHVAEMIVGERKAEKAAEESLRADIGYGSIVNFMSRTDFEFLAGVVEGTNRGAALTAVTKARLERSATLSSLPEGLATGAGFAFWDHGRLVVLDGGTATSISVVRDVNYRRLNNVRVLSEYGRVVGRLISASVTGNRVLAVESDKFMAFMAGGHAIRVDTGPIVALRTYRRSLRYRRLATATTSTALWLLAVTRGEGEEGGEDPHVPEASRYDPHHH